MRKILAIIALVALTACQESVPMPWLGWEKNERVAEAMAERGYTVQGDILLLHGVPVWELLRCGDNGYCAERIYLGPTSAHDAVYTTSKHFHETWVEAVEAAHTKFLADIEISETKEKDE